MEIKDNVTALGDLKRIVPEYCLIDVYDNEWDLLIKQAQNRMNRENSVEIVNGNRK